MNDIDIAEDIMTRETLEEIERLFIEYRNRAMNLKSGDLEHLARLLERKPREGGRHPHIYKSPLHGLKNVPIPGHPKALGTLAHKILNELEPDVEAWREYLDRQERLRTGGDGHGRK